MTIAHVSGFLLFAVVAAITPGPSNLLLTSTGAKVGVVRGLPALAGVAMGMGLMIFLVALELGSLVLAHPLLLQVLKWGGVAVLLWLAWKIATAGRSDLSHDSKPVGFLGQPLFNGSIPNRGWPPLHR